MGSQDGDGSARFAGAVTSDGSAPGDGIQGSVAELIAELSGTIEHLQLALESRAVIEQAKGILMARQGCSPDAAFDMLRRASQRENRKLREIATELVEHARTR